MAFTIIRDNIINVRADAIVNTANPYVYVGKGVDETIYNAAGREELLAERAKIGEMEPGQVAATPAFNLPAKYILHTVSPVWRDGGSGERAALRDCYRNTLALAEELGCETVAFPFLATGNDHFPKDEAIQIATEEINSFLLEHDLDVILVVYDTESYAVSSKLFSDIDAYIEEHEAVPDLDTPYESAVAAFGRVEFGDESDEAPAEAERALVEVEGMLDEADGASSVAGSTPAVAGSALAKSPVAQKRLRVKQEPQVHNRGSLGSGKAASKSAEQDSLEARLANLDKTFQEYLFTLIDRAGYKDSYVYKRANLTKQHFSKIRSDREYHPAKKTAVALALALELNLDETQDLLMRAGYVLSNSSKFDLLIRYCIEKKIYNVIEVNLILDTYGQELLNIA